MHFYRFLFAFVFISFARCCCRTTVSKEKWEDLEGTFVLSDKPDRVVFYIEGPAPGVNLLIESVSIFGDVSLPFLYVPIFVISNISKVTIFIYEYMSSLLILWSCNYI